MMTSRVPNRFSIVLPAAIFGALAGCAYEQEIATEVTPWVWTAGVAGEVRSTEAGLVGTNLDFRSSLDFERFQFIPGLDAAVNLGSSEIDLTVWGVSLRGSSVFGAPVAFSGVPFAPGVNIRSEFDLFLVRLGYSTSFGKPDAARFTMGGALQVIDFDLDLRSATPQAASLDGTASLLVVDLSGSIPVHERVLVRLDAQGLSIPRLFGIRGDFFDIRDEFLTWRLGADWRASEHVAVHLRLVLFLMDIANSEGDRLETTFFGPEVGVTFRF